MIRLAAACRLVPILALLSGACSFGVSDPARTGADAQVNAHTDAQADAQADDRCSTGSDPLWFAEPRVPYTSSDLGVVVGICATQDNVDEILLYLNDTPVRAERGPRYAWGTANSDEEDRALLGLTPGVYTLRAVATGRGSYDGAEATLVVTVEEEAPAAFSFSSGVSTYDEAYRLALSEVRDNIVDGSLIAGAGWTQLWTRDTAYAVQLGVGLLHPGTAQAALERCTETVNGIGTTWLQDVCGHFGGWPNLSDAIVGAQGAWALYTVTGDESFLAWAYEVTRNSLRRAENDVHDQSSGLFLGCSSFMESNSGYPMQYRGDGAAVGATKALSTNLLYYTGYRLGAMMGERLGASAAEVAELNEKAAALRSAIRARLWLPDQGYYAYFEAENGSLVTTMEGLGESLALLAPDFESDGRRIDSIFANTHRTNLGLPCLWPRFSHADESDIANYYHNGRLWPFVQGYWARAAARHDRVDVLAEEFANLVELALRHDTFAEFYELDGTFPAERRRQLWSAAGFLTMVYHSLFGMVFVPEGIRFDPAKPPAPFADRISLRRVQYRDMVVRIYLSGSGTSIRSFKLDGNEQPPFISGDLTGEHAVEITLESR